MKNLKKKILLLIVVLVTAVLLVSGCSTDSLKERMPGVKANVNMLLADNDEGDLEYQVGEIKGEESFEDESEDSFGTQIIADIEVEIKNITESKTIEKNSDEFPDNLPSGSGTVDDITTISVTTDQAQNLESINFSGGELAITVSTSETTSTLKSLTIDGKEATITDNEARLDLNNGPDLTKNSLDISYEIEVDDVSVFDQISFDLSFSSDLEIENLEVDLGEFDVKGSDYDLTMTETLIEDYEKEEFIDALIVSDSNLFVNFEIAEGINLDLSNVEVRSTPVSGNKFILSAEDLTSENNRTELNLDRIVSMLQDPDTSDVLIDGEIGLTSDGIITITRESELGVKNAVLESAELTIDNYKLEPEAAEEGLTASEVDDIKKALESIELTVEGLTNPLPAAVDLKLYVKDGAATEEELYTAENLVKTFNLKANTNDISETLILNNDKFDKFIGNNIYLGVELYSDTTFIPEEYSEKIIEAAQIEAKFNIDLSLDDIDE